MADKLLIELSEAEFKTLSTAASVGVTILYEPDNLLEFVQMAAVCKARMRELGVDNWNALIDRLKLNAGIAWPHLQTTITEASTDRL